MNNRDFTQHFIRALEKIGVGDYEAIRIVAEPVFEKGKWTAQTYDEIMRLQILPRKRVLSFEEAVSLFTFWEGYYPCWIAVSMVDNQVYLRTSLRMRKSNREDDIYPFRVEGIS